MIKIRSDDELNSRLVQITGDIADLEYLIRKYTDIIERLRKYEDSGSKEPFESEESDKLTYRAYYDIRDLKAITTPLETIPECIRVRAQVEGVVAKQRFNLNEHKIYGLITYIAIRLYQIVFNRPYYMLPWYNANKSKYSKYISEQAIQDDVEMIRGELNGS